MSFLTLGLGWSTPPSHTRIQAPHPLAIRKKPDLDARIQFFVQKGEILFLLPSKYDGFSRVRVRRSGRWVGGYLFTDDLEVKPERKLDRAAWGLGGSGVWTQLRHSGLKFETRDQVNYTTEDYASQATSPYIVAQFGRRRFWRVTLGQRMTRYETRARDDVSQSSRKATLEHEMISVTAQTAWSPFSSFEPFYAGFGVEFARATSTTLTLEGTKLSLDDAESLPFYLGAQGLLGFQFFLSPRFSLFLEGRALAFPNQSPPIYGGEAAGGLIYWVH
ncbi:MAG: hypothetical protein AB7G93_15820 [Bdellovibrionales bacterium]